MTIRWKYLAILVIVAPLLGLGFAWSGLMSVKASTGHWGMTDWFLHWVMRNSIRTAALSIEVPPLDNPALLPPAAGHFETGCAICHGSPAQKASGAVLAMLPPPPDLKTVVPGWSDAELFEIVKHGVRFTGMPAWPAQVRDDEVWDMVAFLRKLPGMDGNAYLQASGLHGIGTAGEVSPLPITCESCHAEKRLNGNSVIPRLAGQSEAYLLNSLRAYAHGERASGVMKVAVGTLAEESLPELAAYYAKQARPQGLRRRLIYSSWKGAARSRKGEERQTKFPPASVATKSPAAILPIRASRVKTPLIWSASSASSMQVCEAGLPSAT